jgi:Ca-activated chloride channel family protein
MKTRCFSLILIVSVCAGWWLGCASQKSPKNITTMPSREVEVRFDGISEPMVTVTNSTTWDESDLYFDRFGAEPLNGTPVPALQYYFRKQNPQRPQLTQLERQQRSLAMADYAGEELWVIYRPPSERAADDDQYPGTGALMTRVEEKEAALPLKHTDVKANVVGYIASVDVTQQFENPYDQKIEAVYVFPLPENGAVNEFVMQVGARRIRGIVRERYEAERIYADAKRQGYTASLLTQERPNIFKQSVANIEPGKRIDISIRYYNTLAYADGWYEFVFPMVVGPRFNPPGSYGGVGAVPASALAQSGQPTDVHYLKPGMRNGHDIALELEVDAGVSVEQIECRTHKILLQGHNDPLGSTTRRIDGKSFNAKLASSDAIPNKDFVLRFRVAGKTMKTAMVTHEDHRGGFFTMMLYPPAAIEELERAPLELVFVLDCSGSMSGEPLKQAKAAIRHALKNMDERDTFQLINFSVDARQFGREPVRASRENIARALRYLDSLQSEGGTMMIEGVKAALDFPHDDSRLRFVCFMTDGYIGNEADILYAVHEKLGESRIFSFGVGSSVNRYLLDSMAKVGRGTVAYLGLKDDGAKVMDDFFTRISHPALTDVKIDWNGFRPTDVYPKRLPDLFVGRPLVITGRYEADGKRPGVVELSGKAGKNRIKVPINARTRTDSVAGTNPALPSVWARTKIAELMQRETVKRDLSISEQIKKTALDFQLLSPYTAFLALDASRRTEGATATTVPVAVPVPEGVRYETTVE